jgi:hypothetical protein
MAQGLLIKLAKRNRRPGRTACDFSDLSMRAAGKKLVLLTVTNL